MTLRVVFDTNIIVSVLLFQYGKLAWLRDLWCGNLVAPLASRATVEELLRVLAYPKFKLAREEQATLLTDFLPHVDVIEVERDSARAARCRDPLEEKFLILAETAMADALVTGDKDLLALADQFPIPIISPAAWRRGLSCR